MPRYLGRQPDGTYVIFSTVVMGNIAENMTKEQAAEAYNVDVDHVDECAMPTDTEEWDYYTAPAFKITLEDI